MSKNDAIDAALISRFADKIGVRVLEAQEVEAVELKRKAKFRQTMVDSRTAMINRRFRDCSQGNAAVKCVANNHIFYAHIFIIAIASRTTCVVEYQAEASKASRRSIMRKRR